MIRYALRPSSAPPPVAATIHIYRGIMDRAGTWRVRIDNPTNWAIVTCGTAVSFTLSDEAHPHAVLLLVMLFVIMFVVVEARRTRYYDLWGSWLRLLETEYLAPILQDNIVTVNDTWQELLVRDLGFPHFKASLWKMIQRRMRDHYMAVYLFLLVSWLLKLLLHPATQSSCSANAFTCHASVGPVPGWLVLTAVGGFYLVLVGITLLAYTSNEVTIEVLSRERTLQKIVSPSQQPVNRLHWHADSVPLEFSASDEDLSVVED
jgi:uncharacterized membrane protein